MNHVLLLLFLCAFFFFKVDLLLRVHHKNLVSLVGYCEKGNDLALVYEYMANGDLKEILSGKQNLNTIYINQLSNIS